MLAFACLKLHAGAQHVITGTVSDTENNPLTGANVILIENQKGAVTDKEGNFRFTSPPGDYTIQVSFVGYETFLQELNVRGDKTLSFTLKETSIIGDEIIVSATRAGERTPTTYTEMVKDEIEARNLAQDLPYLMQMEPGVVSTSDAGAGVGYTNIRIRGSDITRINVTVNGVPLNDAESHGVFWVNTPDIASTVENIQIQRGVGTSTNGAGAFGATINLQTNRIQENAHGEVNSSFGSFNTFKNNIQLGTGLINGKWSFEGRASKITSDGYIDRASSDLSSYFLQGGFYSEKTTIKAVFFGGHETTYQAWNGIDPITMETDRTFNSAGAIYDENWNIIDFYDNEVDNYRQDHYQLHFSRLLSPALSINLSLHYTYGRGYFEQYKSNEFMPDYGVAPLYFGRDSVFDNSGYSYFYHDTVSTSDFIVRRWLDNDFYGTTYSLQYEKGNLFVIAGGGYNRYDNADHFGEIIWAEFPGNSNIRDRYYDNDAFKSDFNAFVKANYQLFGNFNFFTDIQYRGIKYIASGIDKGGASISINKSFDFFNPKVGLSYVLGKGELLYGSFAVANREPVRNDYLDAPRGEFPKHETLNDIEFGYRMKKDKFFAEANGYHMNYKNQLVLTGELNDVGNPIRENIGESYRAGIELNGGMNVATFLDIAMNLSLSRNKTDYNFINNEGNLETIENVDIAYSPDILGGGQVLITPVDGLEIAWLAKYVGKQYLDNTGNKDLILEPYFLNDLRLGYKFPIEMLSRLELNILINNIFNVKYASNGYVWGTTPYYYPQAGTNFLAGMKVRF